MSSGRVALGPTAFSAKQNTACRLSLKPWRGCGQRLQLPAGGARRRKGNQSSLTRCTPQQTDRQTDGAPRNRASRHSPAVLVAGYEAEAHPSGESCSPPLSPRSAGMSPEVGLSCGLESWLCRFPGPEPGRSPSQWSVSPHYTDLLSSTLPVNEDLKTGSDYLLGHFSASLSRCQDRPCARVETRGEQRRDSASPGRPPIHLPTGQATNKQ